MIRITCLPEKIQFLKFIASLKLTSLRNPALYGNRICYLKPRMTVYRSLNLRYQKTAKVEIFFIPLNIVSHDLKAK